MPRCRRWRPIPRAAAAWVPRMLAGAYDPAVAAGGGEGRRDGRHGDDREAGRLGRARQHHPGRAGRRGLAAHRAQVVLLGADVGRFLTLAQAPGGLTCFLVPRWTPAGERNAIQLMRLKDKLGNRANASAEIEYHGAFAWRWAAQGEGVRTIIEMVHHTRLDTAMAPAGLMRAALSRGALVVRRAARRSRSGSSTSR